jgi:cephalosporin-C deacetylase-like acetyl esterase
MALPLPMGTVVHFDVYSSVYMIIKLQLLTDFSVNEYVKMPADTRGQKRKVEETVNSLHFFS